MYGTGMDAYTFKHFQNVARNMNIYVAASAYDYYSGRDRIPMVVYQPVFYPMASLGERFASELYSVGLPDSLANIGYRVGDLIDSFM